MRNFDYLIAHYNQNRQSVFAGFDCSLSECFKGNVIIDTQHLKRYILNSADDARLLIAERELNEFSDSAESMLIIGKGDDWLHEILSQLRIRFDAIDLTKNNKLLYCIFYNRFSDNKLNISDVSAISRFFERFTELTPVFGIYQNDRQDDAVELMIFFE